MKLNYLKIHYVIFFVIFVLFFRNISAELISDVEYNLLPQLVKIERYESCKLNKLPQKYCVFDIKIHPVSNTSNYISNLIQILNNDPRNFRHDLLTRGLCLDARNKTIHNEYDYYREILNREFHGSEFEIENITDVVCDYFDREMDSYDILGLTIIILIIVLVFVATYLDIVMFKNLPSNKLSLGLKCLQSFSLTKNWTRFQTIKKSPDNLQFIQGIRFLSIALIVFGHTVLFLLTSPIDNPYFLEKQDHIFTSGFILNGAVIVQTYFWMSGMFLGYAFFKIMAKHTFHIKYLTSAIFLRYIRFIPSFGILTLICTTILYHMGEGPFWEKIIGFDRNICRSNWWTNFLLISNELQSDQMCLINGWYVSADFQLSLISLVLITLIWFKKAWTLRILGVAFVISILVPGIVTYVYELDPLPLTFIERVKYIFANDKTYHMTYLQPHTNASTYFLGLIFGYLLYTGDITRRPFRNKWFIISLRIIGWTFPFIVLFGGYIFYTDYYKPNRVIAAIFQSIYKVMFVTTPLLILWIMKSTRIKIYRQILEWKLFVILGRLSFGIYLVNWPLLRALSGMDMTPVYVGFYSVIAVRFISVLIMSIFFAAILALFVEFPVSSLMKLLMPSDKEFGDDSQQRVQKISFRSPQNSQHASTEINLENNNIFTPQTKKVTVENSIVI